MNAAQSPPMPKKQEGTNKKRNDWRCICGNLVFRQKEKCGKCGKEKNEKSHIVERKADTTLNWRVERQAMPPKKTMSGWTCAFCKASNFGKSDKCKTCSAGKAQSRNRDKRRAKNKKSRNDWDCFSCGTYNFATRKQCFKCDMARPDEEEEKKEEKEDKEEKQQEEVKEEEAREIEEEKDDLLELWPYLCL